MRYKQILDCSIADGEGVRVVLFVTGCSHHCIGCHNPKCQNENEGKLFTTETLGKLLKLLDRDYIDGLTLSGGDPLYINNREIIELICQTIKEKLPNKTIWLYTGYRYEEIYDLNLLKYIDVLVDGKFEMDKRDITLPFRGSSNQKIIKLIGARNTDEENNCN